MAVSRLHLHLHLNCIASGWHCPGLQEPEAGEGGGGDLAEARYPDRAGSSQGEVSPGSWEILPYSAGQPWFPKASLARLLPSRAAFPAVKSQGVLFAAGGSRSALPKQMCKI